MSAGRWFRRHVLRQRYVPVTVTLHAADGALLASQPVELRGYHRLTNPASITFEGFAPATVRWVSVTDSEGKTTRYEV